MLIGTFTGLVLVATFGLAYSDSGVFGMKGAGATVINTENPKLYSSNMRITLSDSSTVDKGDIIVRGSDMSVVVRFVSDKWTFAYNNDVLFMVKE